MASYALSLYHIVAAAFAGVAGCLGIMLRSQFVNSSCTSKPFIDIFQIGVIAAPMALAGSALLAGIFHITHLLLRESANKYLTIIHWICISVTIVISAAAVSLGSYYLYVDLIAFIGNSSDCVMKHDLLLINAATIAVGLFELLICLASFELCCEKGSTSFAIGSGRYH
ncbi:hypothetical protein TrispH2_002669 [Trichoplax sp. H2]|uniref:Uncharacterized protein n=1 Tax=Trichoplax adhaerens TaxID=10228 RepID=B3RPD0_TRIAD|nr:predicted protein [Trichoplax adhaerens]EDV28168.1 predicted protein [Trichoplax adhaerens]RDD45445.1 hypothetical protein TrispH2_002669 [Trichoplax sp. H2]|eukprot:XP_002110002.1 predicted protein [Trichoplax adhaerens]